MYNIRKFNVRNLRNELISARFVMPDDAFGKIPIVIMLTGDGPKGSNSLSWINLAPKLAEKKVATLLFDFTGLGSSEGTRKNLTLSKGISDFNAIFHAIEKIDWIDFDNIGILASSFGGSVALHCYEILNSTKAIGLKSPCCFLPDAYVNEISNAALNEWLKKGFCESNGYDIEVLIDPFKYNIYDDIKKIKTKCLITHGDNDEIVPLTQSIFLNKLLQSEHELMVFDNCDHGYSTGNSWDKMANLFVNFFVENLKQDEK